MNRYFEVMFTVAMTFLIGSVMGAPETAVLFGVIIGIGLYLANEINKLETRNQNDKI